MKWVRLAKVDNILWINLSIFENDVHVFGIVGTRVEEALHFIVGVNERRPCQALSADRRSSANGTRVNHAIDLQRAET